MRSLALLALVALGCSPSFSDGQYTCPDGRCPSTLVCWASDGFCHYGPDPGGDPDSGVPGDASTACSSTMAGNCPSGEMCVVGAWVTGMPSLQCADATTVRPAQHGRTCTPMNDHDCTPPDACVTVAGSGSFCMRPCGAMGEPCGFDEDCITPAGVTGAMPRVCAPMCTRECGTVPVVTQLTCSGSNYCLPPDW